jgi:SAM-dependent methyltransferase
MHLAQDPPAPLKIDMSCDTRTLLIVFGGMIGGAGTPHFDFLPLIRDIPVKRIAVRDLRQAWYHRGIPGHGTTINEAAEALAVLASDNGADRIITVGTSAGGYAALLFAALLGAEQAHCFAAQTVLDLDALADMNDHRWERSLTRLTTEDALDSRWTDLLTVLSQAGGCTRYHVYFDDSFRPDREHAERLKMLDRVQLYRFGMGRHQIAHMLSEGGVLKPMLRRAAALPGGDASEAPAVDERHRQHHQLLKDHFTDLYAFFTKFVEQDTGPLTLLDFGCGRSGYVNLYCQRFAKCFGLDIVDYAAHYDSEEVEFVLSNGSDIPLPDRSVDVVVAHSVLEHVEDVEFTISEMNRVLVEGGYAYLTVSPLYFSSGGGHLRVKPGARRLSDWEHLNPDSPHYLGVDETPASPNKLGYLNKLTTSKFLATVGRQPWDILAYRIAAEAHRSLPPFLCSGNISRVDLYTKELRMIARKAFSVVADEVVEAPAAPGPSAASA